MGDIAKLLLNISNDLPLSGGGEGITFINWDCVRDTISRIKDNTGGSARSVQRKHCLDCNVHGRGVEGLEHDLRHLLSVGLGVEGCLGQEDWVLFGGYSQLVVEGVVPNLLHVIPVGHDTVLNGVF